MIVGMLDSPCGDSGRWRGWKQRCDLERGGQAVEDVMGQDVGTGLLDIAMFGLGQTALS